MTNESINYEEVEKNMLENGSIFQKKCIRWIHNNKIGTVKTRELKRFIDIELARGGF